MNRSRKISKEMMSQRGYQKISENDTEIIFKNKTEKVLLTYYENEKISIQIIKNSLELLKEKKLNHIILIYNEKFTACAKQFIKTLDSIEEVDNVKKVIFETFDVNELQINITKHELSSKHELAPQKELEEVLKIVKDTKFIPKIFKHDPMCKFYNFQENDVLKAITDDDGYVDYRKVIIEK